MIEDVGISFDEGVDTEEGVEGPWKIWNIFFFDVQITSELSDGHWLSSWATDEEYSGFIHIFAMQMFPCQGIYVVFGYG